MVTFFAVGGGYGSLNTSGENGPSHYGSGFGGHSAGLGQAGLFLDEANDFMDDYSLMVASGLLPTNSLSFC